MNDKRRVAREHFTGRVVEQAFCPHPDKRRYYTRTEARAAKRRIATTDAHVLRAYLCDCGFWHLGHRRVMEAAPIQCARKFRSGMKCAQPATHKFECSGGHAWLCEEHFTELYAVARSAA